jgi:hypothetical protein
MGKTYRGRERGLDSTFVGGEEVKKGRERGKSVYASRRRPSVGAHEGA